jgi:hypothetical protein
MLPLDSSASFFHLLFLDLDDYFLLQNFSFGCFGFGLCYETEEGWIENLELLRFHWLGGLK